MAKTKASGRPSVLSEEYVVDSNSDGGGEVDWNVQTNTKALKTPKTPEHPSKPKGTSLSSKIRKVASGDDTEVGMVNGQQEATENPSSSPDGSSDEKESEDQRDEKVGKIRQKRAMKPM